MKNVGSPICTTQHESNSSVNQKLLQCLLVSFIARSKSSMMPLPPSSTDLPRAQKPKIGFSIDSIVGGEGERKVCSIPSTQSHPSINHRSEKYSSDDNEQYSQASSTSSPEEPSFTDISEKPTTAKHLNPFTHLHNQNQFLNNNRIANSSNIGHVQRPIILPNHHLLSQGSNNSSPLVNQSSGISSPSSTTTNALCNNPNTSNRIISSSKNFRYNSDGVTTTSSPSPPLQPHPTNHSRSPSPLENSSDSLSTKSPISLSSLHTLPQDSHHLQNPVPRSQHHHHTPHSHLAPHLPPVGPHGMPQFTGYPPGMLNFAAAVAAVQHHQHPGLPGWMPPGGPHPPHHHTFYPWLLTKHSRLFPYRFGPGPDLPGFLLQPFRKPKRIRTAFSPSQLLKLEHAFERNHYVVGAERKQLASSLSLSETQVKVWYQNRRTKHKRMQQEEESMKKSGVSGGNNSSGSNLSSSAISADSSTRNNYILEDMMSEEEEDEEIIMDDSYLVDEEEMGHLNQSLNRVM